MNLKDYYNKEAREHYITINGTARSVGELNIKKAFLLELSKDGRSCRNFLTLKIS